MDAGGDSIAARTEGQCALNLEQVLPNAAIHTVQPSAVDRLLFERNLGLTMKVDN